VLRFDAESCRDPFCERLDPADLWHPKEVLQSILARVRNSGRLANIVPYLRVCHRWYEDGNSLVWRTLVLDKNKMDKLIVSTVQYNHPFRLVTALTVSGGVPYPKRCFCECHEHYSVQSDSSNHQARCLDDNSEIWGELLSESWPWSATKWPTSRLSHCTSIQNQRKSPCHSAAATILFSMSDLVRTSSEASHQIV
jgi:hypothetical protein